ncbi:MAG: UDP-N-acetylglucosamine 2-epimerase (non-hydrolyzing) [Mariprofundaceae bacterium]|nr:UDP-N-acetylglucosamine 2-epimerase (non-hydrolyzing) [Mariprofundaceae bacterium]
MMNILLVAGARPNFMKIAPMIRAMKSCEGLNWSLVHTGQHYDFEMSQSFFEDLEIPRPDYFLNVGSGSHAAQTASTMVEFEQVCLEANPDVVVVVGDVNSTLACSIVAKKLGISVAHVEAGLRSFDLTMPEEINRMVTDAISDFFFVTEQSGVDNLLREGKAEENIHFVGHVMIDNLLYQVSKLEDAPASDFVYADLKQELGEYIFLTLHRPSNVDCREVLAGLVQAVNHIAEQTPVVFPVHPRTRKMIDKFKLNFSEHVHCLPPLGFKEALYLWKDAQLVLTDSGSLQEETTALGVPCITLRENTERPITCEVGTNQLVGNDPEKICSAVADILGNDAPVGHIPPLWDGKASERIAQVLAEAFGSE